MGNKNSQQSDNPENFKKEVQKFLKESRKIDVNSLTKYGKENANLAKKMQSCFKEKSYMKDYLTSSAMAELNLEIFSSMLGSVINKNCSSTFYQGATLMRLTETNDIDWLSNFSDYMLNWIHQAFPKKNFDRWKECEDEFNKNNKAPFEKLVGDCSSIKKEDDEEFSGIIDKNDLSLEKASENLKTLKTKNSKNSIRNKNNKEPPQNNDVMTNINISPEKNINAINHMNNLNNITQNSNNKTSQTFKKSIFLPDSKFKKILSTGDPEMNPISEKFTNNGKEIQQIKKISSKNINEKNSFDKSLKQNKDYDQKTMNSLINVLNKMPLASPKGDSSGLNKLISDNNFIKNDLLKTEEENISPVKLDPSQEKIILNAVSNQPSPETKILNVPTFKDGNFNSMPPGGKLEKPELIKKDSKNFNPQQYNPVSNFKSDGELIKNKDQNLKQGSRVFSTEKNILNLERVHSNNEASESAWNKDSRATKFSNFNRNILNYAKGESETKGSMNKKVSTSKSQTPPGFSQNRTKNKIKKKEKKNDFNLNTLTRLGSKEKIIIQNLKKDTITSKSKKKIKETHSKNKPSKKEFRVTRVKSHNYPKIDKKHDELVMKKKSRNRIKIDIRNLIDDDLDFDKIDSSCSSDLLKDFEPEKDYMPKTKDSKFVPEGNKTIRNKLTFNPKQTTKTFIDLKKKSQDENRMLIINHDTANNLNLNIHINSNNTNNYNNFNSSPFSVINNQTQNKKKQINNISSKKNSINIKEENYVLPQENFEPILGRYIN